MMRTGGPEGFTGNKDRSLNSDEQLREWREDWAHRANHHLERHGHEARPRGPVLEHTFGPFASPNSRWIGPNGVSLCQPGDDPESPWNVASDLLLSLSPADHPPHIDPRHRAFGQVAGTAMEVAADANAAG